MSEIEIAEIQEESKVLLTSHLEKLPSYRSLNEEAKQEDLALTSYSLHQLILGSDILWTLHVKALKNAQPRILRNAIREAKDKVSLLNSSNYLIIAAPYLSQQAAEICTKEGVGFIDLSGNTTLTFDSTYIEVTGKPNLYKETRPLKSLFSAKSSRVLRVLMQGPLKAHKIQSIVDSAGVSLGLVSKVRKLLIDHELAEDTSDGIIITQPEKLLDDWLATDNFNDRTEVREYSLLESDQEYVATTLEALTKSPNDIAFTQWYAGHLRAPYTAPPVVSAYVEDFLDEKLLETVLKARRVSSGGRLRLLRSKDHIGVTLGKQKVGEHTLVSDLQILLDLKGAGLRADEQAHALRKSKNFNDGWDV